MGGTVCVKQNRSTDWAVSKNARTWARAQDWAWLGQRLYLIRTAGATKPASGKKEYGFLFSGPRGAEKRNP
jgi:hypothetical protein